MANMRDMGGARGSDWTIRDEAMLATYWDVDAARSHIGTCDECGDESTIVQRREHPSGDIEKEDKDWCKECFEGWGE